MMEKHEIQKLRDLPIEGVAERLGMRVMRHKSLCPFHDDHKASLSFDVRKNRCRCFVCMTESLGTIDLVMRHLRVDFKEACKWLADGSLSPTLTHREGTESCQKVKDNCFDPKRYERFFISPILNESAKRFLFEERRLDARVIRWCRVSSWRDRNGVNLLQMPYFDMDGRLIGVQNRNLEKGASPRFWYPQGNKSTIYNMPMLKHLREGDDLYITEGCSDCWAMLSAGHKAIAIPSATLLTSGDMEMLTTITGRLGVTMHMYPDNDAPGEGLFLQLREAIPTIVHHQLPVGCKDFSDYYVTSKNEERRIKDGTV